MSSLLTALGTMTSLLPWKAQIGTPRSSKRARSRQFIYVNFTSSWYWLHHIIRVPYHPRCFGQFFQPCSDLAGGAPDAATGTAAAKPQKCSVADEVAQLMETTILKTSRQWPARTTIQKHILYYTNSIIYITKPAARWTCWEDSGKILEDSGRGTVWWNMMEPSKVRVQHQDTATRCSNQCSGSTHWVTRNIQPVGKEETKKQTRTCPSSREHVNIYTYIYIYTYNSLVWIDIDWYSFLI